MYMYIQISVGISSSPQLCSQEQGIGHHGLKARVADARKGFGVVEVHLLGRPVRPLIHGLPTAFPKRSGDVTIKKREFD